MSQLVVLISSWNGCKRVGTSAQLLAVDVEQCRCVRWLCAQAGLLRDRDPDRGLEDPVPLLRVLLRVHPEARVPVVHAHVRHRVPRRLALEQVRHAQISTAARRSDHVPCAFCALRTAFCVLPAWLFTLSLSLRAYALVQLVPALEAIPLFEAMAPRSGTPPAALFWTLDSICLPRAHMPSHLFRAPSPLTFSVPL